jgi:hypothetical protein
MTIPFAPVIIARAGGTLFAQSFVESNPASGLVLIAPPPSNEAVASQPSTSPPLLPTPLPEFTYEPLFPLAILGTSSQLATLQENHRLFSAAPTKNAAPERNRLLGALTGRRGRGRWDVDTIEVPEHGLDGQEAFVGIEQWLDSVGV